MSFLRIRVSRKRLSVYNINRSLTAGIKVRVNNTLNNTLFMVYVKADGSIKGSFFEADASCLGVARLREAMVFLLYVKA